MVWHRTASAKLERSPPPRPQPRVSLDLEKHYDQQLKHGDPDSEEEVRISRRLSIQHNQPLLPSARSRSHFYEPARRTGFSLRLRRGSMRCSCLAVAGILVLFVLSLVRLSHKSDSAVHKAIAEEKANPPPPVWESFPFLTRYWSGVRTLRPVKDNKPEYPTDEDLTTTPQQFQRAAEEAKRESNKLANTRQKRAHESRSIPDSIEFNPYPNYTAPEYIAEFGVKVDCFLDTAGKVQIPEVRVYQGIPNGFPAAAFGSAELIGIRSDICYDRFGRWGPYGLGYSLNQGGTGSQMNGEREGADLVWRNVPEVDYRKVNWADVQARCGRSNRHRFAPLPDERRERFTAMQVGRRAERAGETIQSRAEIISRPDATSGDLVGDSSSSDKLAEGQSRLQRTAIVIRTWWDYAYTPEDLMYLRSLIAELHVHTGGEYTLHFLIQVKSDDEQIWSDDETYERVLHNALPEEFHGMGTLWTERQMFLVYGGLEESMMRGLPVHGVYRSAMMPLQYFAYNHPEYDYFWNWEMDLRSTHHWYHFLETVAKWAKNQPRKLLWERNARFFIPSEYGTWDDFNHTVRVQTEHGTSTANNLWSGLKAGGHEAGQNLKIQGDRPIWGPEYPQDDHVAFDADPAPPTTPEKDHFRWGVGEEADLIVFNPLFDPDGTSWLLAEDVTGYNRTNGLPPRRTAVITASRMSRKLLMTMHKELVKHRHTMFSEMWPASCALHHGLKAVYVPHPVYIDRKWPTHYLAQTFNGGRNGASGGARTSVFGDREHNFRGTTWYYNAGFPEVLWHRWLGMKMHGEGGEVFETGEGVAHDGSRRGEGRMCLPGMLLHPVKRVELVIEGRRDQ